MHTFKNTEIAVFLCRKLLSLASKCDIMPISDTMQQLERLMRCKQWPQAIKNYLNF